MSSDQVRTGLINYLLLQGDRLDVTQNELNAYVWSLPRQRSRRSYGLSFHVEWVELFRLEPGHVLTLGITANGHRTLQLHDPVSEYPVTVLVGRSTGLTNAIHDLKLRAIMLKRPTQSRVDGSTSTPAGWEDYPHLVSFLTDTQYSDGSPRQRGTIGLSYDNGWKLIVRDTENSRVAFYGGDSIDEVWASLSIHLGDDTLDWRPDKFAKKGKAK